MSRIRDPFTGVFNSLRARFISASLVCMPLFVGASGLLLERAFKESLASAEFEQLQSQIYLLLSAGELQNGQLWLPEQLVEPRYATLNSGLYGVVSLIDDKTGRALQWQSDSSLLVLPSLPLSRKPFSTNRQSMYEGSAFFRFSQDVLWLDHKDQAVQLRFEVFHSHDTYLQQVQEYRRQLWYGLSVMTMMLISIQALILSWGHRPLRDIAREIRRIAAGTSHRLAGRYPTEVRALTDSLNDLLDGEEQQRDRYKNTLGDLAHSLKTPLAILLGEAQQPTQNLSVMKEQLDRMQTIIQHQLQRAVLTTQHHRHAAIEIAPIAQRLCAAMEKVYRDKGIKCEILIEEHVSYPIESQDLFELLGNVIENGCKYGRSRVAINAYLLADSLVLSVADDGPGIPNEQQRTILQRGARADTAKPGQGIGLAVTTDIVSAYGGSVEVRKSPHLGGAEFQIRLPIRRIL